MRGFPAAFDQALRRRFGRKRGLLNVALAKLALLAGRYDGLGQIQYERVDRLVFVCTGNICRSPFGEAVARSLGASATSFGVRAREGAVASAEAVRAAIKRGIDLREHRSRRQVDLRPGDLVLALEPMHLELVSRSVREAGGQATLLGLLAASAQPHIEDPFGLSPEYYDTCFAIIEDAARRVVERTRRAR